MCFPRTEQLHHVQRYGVSSSDSGRLIMNSYCALSELTVENFKSFGERRQHMPIRPLTLIYGPNSSGKSSLLQAIALAHEANRTGIVDTKKTELAGESIDLGGFRQYVHCHDLNRDVNLGFALDIGDPEQVFIEFVIGAETISSARGTHPQINVYTKQYTVRFDGEAVLSIQFDSSGYGELTVQKEHPHLSGGSLLACNIWIQRGKLFPTFSKPSSKKKVIIRSFCLEYMKNIESAFSASLQSLSYLGPLRYFPNRDFSNEPRRGDPNWTSGGAAAWHWIRQGNLLRESINQWLGDSDKLRTPYKLTIQRFVDESDPNSMIEYPRFIDMLTKAIVSPKDIGIGVSQVLPVLAMVLGLKRRLIAIEQPELHLHPAIQSELADVFLKSALHHENKIIIETHSEHLILRILRRIRESTESGNKNSSHLHVEPDHVSVVYVQPTDTGSRVFEIPLTSEGEFGAHWPEGFFGERVKELF